MTDQERAAMQQALECLRGVARGKYDGNAAGVCAALEAALAQQAEPVDTDCHTQGICQRSGYGIPKP